MNIRKSLLTIFSDGSNTDLDFTKVLGGIAFVVFLGISIHVYVHKDKDWDAMTWSSAVAVLLGAVGGVSKIKDYTTKSTDGDTK